MTDAEKIDALIDCWIWENPVRAHHGVVYGGDFTAWIPRHRSWETNVGLQTETFSTRELARAAIKKAAGIGEEP